MQSHQQFYPTKAVPTFADQVEDNYMHIPVASAFSNVFPPCARLLPPLHGIEFQPSEVCPKNFIIFNQTDHRNQIMFNPAVANNLNSPGLNGLANYIDGRYSIKDVNDVEKETSSSLKEDSDDIDALLSSEEEEQEDYDEEVSTARTYGNYESDSDSHSAYGSKPRKNSSCTSTLKSSGSGGFCDPEKRLKMKKMVKFLMKRFGTSSLSRLKQRSLESRVSRIELILCYACINGVPGLGLLLKLPKLIYCSLGRREK
ncbi:hypothetical protein V6N13_143633 [Hibiscus sabdariffa]